MAVQSRSVAAPLAVVAAVALLSCRGWSSSFIAPQVPQVAAQAQAQALAVAGTAAMLAAAPMPAYAGGMFDFGLTLPFVAFTFVLMTVVLNALWYAPVTEEVDERNAKLLQTLSQATDMLSKADAMQVEYTAKIREARSKASAAVAEYRKKVEEVIDGQQAEAEKNRETRALEVKDNLEREMQAKIASASGEIEKRKDVFVKATLSSISM
ncbi:unnamed protein product [Polarella glacialis]|uniref:ATP synthase subunit b', chloroplastic n=1 Tax=Polarella glacialis TaxID=89957 RepID=A0A813DEA0_POLGL|nr:unnamed protein product [Polarella glacialis]CAE8706947.1 unnamed protein product [Polarella glacialis]|mmetsp:Transcript_78432/g.141506  ORF Transcript_78432/g.141506 Transcript_78432/m.141506 type:complete len:210 (+) Transcript_78432:70-699(+)